MTRLIYFEIAKGISAMVEIDPVLHDGTIKELNPVSPMILTTGEFTASVPCSEQDLVDYLKEEDLVSLEYNYGLMKEEYNDIPFEI